MILTLYLTVWLASASIVSASQPVPLVHTPSGTIQGIVVPVQGRDIVQFRNIPYAKPPVGELRFEKPVPVEPWANTLDGTKFGPSCIQNDKFLPEMWEPLDNKDISEDCLQLNVYVPDSVSETDKKPVMVWIHGGGFTGGSAALYDSSYFALKDVLVVTIQYRVGLFGFLSTGDATLPGNYGLWDIIEALRWVNTNIAGFGGDRDTVTVFGESAGGFCATFLSVIPSTKGLFKRVIVQSGSAAGNMFISKDPFRVAERVGRHNGCITDTETAIDKEALVNCLKGKSAQDLLNAQLDPTTLFFGGFSMEVHLWPVVDGDLLVRRPIDILNDPRSKEFQYFQSIDLIAGTTDNEASLLPFIAYHLQGPMNFNLSDGIPTSVLCDLFAPAIAKDIYEDNTIVAGILCQRYKKDNLADQARSLSALYGDAQFVGPAVSLLDFHSKGRAHSNTYQYLFTQEIDFYFLAPSFPWSEGAGHGVDCLYMFGPAGFSQYESILTPEGTSLRDAIVTYWTNFAKTGNPNGPGLIPWKTYGPGGRHYMDLNYEPVLSQDIYQQRIQFLLEEIPNKLRQSSKTEL
ncbi:liver carboxylesterase 2-like [Pecten maximus]|uniref:liver carboxylesterase 2-like n=1 Tax=Pecten maximus TaxID=6579 RepID=UPI0014591269|nr:liver carboxylesterase 2-like [Pecten maximus]XP_033742067.1 liver carboxylesterase 2-like [Pecten maximus]